MVKQLKFAILFLLFISFSFSYVYYDYWAEHDDTGAFLTNGKTWFKTDLSSSSSLTLYVYYGGSTDKSNGDNVFEFFDDFDGTTLDTNKWTSSGSITISSSKATIGTGESRIMSLNSYGQNYALKLYARASSPGSTSNYAYWGWGDSTNPGAAPFHLYDSQDPYNAYSYVTGNEYNDLSYDFSQWASWEIVRDGNSSVKFYRNNNLDATHTNQVNSGTRYPGINGGNTGAQVDWVFVRKYNPAATISITYGSEETGSWNINGMTYTKRRQITITSDTDLTAYQVALDNSYFTDNKMAITDDPGQPLIELIKLSPNENETWNPINFKIQITNNYTFDVCNLTINGTVYEMSKINGTVCEKSISLDQGTYIYNFSGNATYNPDGSSNDFFLGNYNVTKESEPINISKNSPNDNEKFQPIYFEIELRSNSTFISCNLNFSGTIYNMTKVNDTLCNYSLSGLTLGSYNYFFYGEAKDNPTNNTFNYTTGTYILNMIRDDLTITKNSPTTTDTVSSFYFEIEAPNTYNLTDTYVYIDGSPYSMTCSENICSKSVSVSSGSFSYYFEGQAIWSGTGEVFNFSTPTYYKGTSSDYFEIYNNLSTTIENLTLRVYSPYLKENFGNKTQFFDVDGNDLPYCFDQLNGNCNETPSDYFIINITIPIQPSQSLRVLIGNEGSPSVLTNYTITTDELNITFYCNGRRVFNDFEGDNSEINSCWRVNSGSISPITVINHENVFLFNHNFIETNETPEEHATALLLYGSNIICPELVIFSNKTAYLNQTWFKKSSACDIKVMNSTSYFLYDFETDSWYLKPAAIYSSNQQYQEEIMFFSSGGGSGSGIISSIPELPYYLVCFERDGIYYIKSKLTSSAFHDVSAESNGSIIYHFNQTTDEFSVAINISNVTNILYKIDEIERCRWENQVNLLGIPKLNGPSNKILNFVIGIPLYLFILTISTIIPFVLMFLFVVNDIIKLLEPSQVALLSIMTGVASAFTNWQGERSTKMLIIFFVMASTYAILFYTIAGIQESNVAQLSQNIEDMRAKFENFDLLSLVLTLPTFLVNLFVFLLTLPLFVFDFLVEVTMEINPLFGSFLQSFKTAFVAGLYAYLALKAYEVVSNRFRTI